MKIETETLKKLAEKQSWIVKASRDVLTELNNQVEGIEVDFDFSYVLRGLDEHKDVRIAYSEGKFIFAIFVICAFTGQFEQDGHELDKLSLASAKIFLSRLEDIMKEFNAKAEKELLELEEIQKSLSILN